MTFSRIASKPVSITVFDTVDSTKETKLRISFNDGSIGDLSVEDALALADYINAKWRTETSE